MLLKLNSINLDQNWIKCQLSLIQVQSAVQNAAAFVAVVVVVLVVD